MAQYNREINIGWGVVAGLCILIAVALLVHLYMNLLAGGPVDYHLFAAGFIACFVGSATLNRSIEYTEKTEEIDK